MLQSNNKIYLILAFFIVVSFHGLLYRLEERKSNVLGVQDNHINFEQIVNDKKVDIILIEKIFTTSDENELKTTLYSSEKIFLSPFSQNIQIVSLEFNKDIYIYDLLITPNNKTAHSLKVQISDQFDNFREQFFFFNLDIPVQIEEKQKMYTDFLLTPLSKYNCLENADIIENISKTTIQDNHNLYVVEKQTALNLKLLLEDANQDGIELHINSAHRSIIEQLKIFKSNQLSLGPTRGSNLTAEPLCSEHHLGTAIDFRVPEVISNGVLYQNTKAYKWLVENASYYGFVNSYPQNNSAGFEFEPWHWRYIGIDHATNYYQIEHLVDPYEYLLLVSTM